MAERVEKGSTAEATDALLSLTYHESDQEWLESFILACLTGHQDSRVRELAVSCLGHVGRIFGSIRNREVVPTLTALLEDEVLGGIAEDALGDIRHFASPA